MPQTNTPKQIVTALPELPIRKNDSHKGTFGRILVIAGSRGMSGAAVLTGSAACRSGAGLVTTAVPIGSLNAVAAGNPCYTTEGLPEDDAGCLAAEALPKINELLPAYRVLAIGPGLGQSSTVSELVQEVVGCADIPVVLDADGLNAFIHDTSKLGQRSCPVVATPHPGEFARLLGVDIKQLNANRRDLAAEFARKYQLILVLKGSATIVTDGEKLYENNSGNPGMATAGSGDVLTGIIAALAGQGLEFFAAAQLGVYLHGRAGDLAAGQVGQISLIATDLIEYLPFAFREL